MGLSVVFLGPDFHSLLIEFKNGLCLFGKGWQGLRSSRQVGEDDLGSFPLDLDAHIGLVLALLTVWFWWTSKNHKHANITKFMRNEIRYSHVIIQSVSTKNFPASFILSKYTRENQTVLFIPLCFLFTAWKRNSRFNLLFWQTKVCQSLDTSKNSDILKTEKLHRLHTQHLRGHYPAEDINHEAKRLPGKVGIVLKFQPFVHTA